LQQSFIITIFFNQTIELMKKSILTVLFFAAVTQLSVAAPVDLAQAQREAKAFIGNAVATQTMRKAPAQARLTLAYQAKGFKGNSYYVFNRGAGYGYVIVSGDDRTAPVLGYVDKGDFDYSQIPSNMKAWLEGYENQINYLARNPQMKNQILRGNGNSVEPLLGDIAWDQGYPYNAKCPAGSATGCVATAVGQVMYYYKWPEKGIGSHSYITSTNEYSCSADFGSTTYEWDKMLPSIDEGSSQEAIDAVSTLLYHVGVSLDMDYDESSGAYSYPISQSLVKYFNYDKGANYRMRGYYTSEDWENMVRNELDNSRPIVYNGMTGQREGHSFVCDGYNAEGYYHINWGWSGQSNGYFLLTALDPPDMGIGGAESGFGFNYGQDMIIGIQPPVEGSKMNYVLEGDGVEDLEARVLRTDSVTFKGLNVYSECYDTIYTNIRFNIYDQENQVVASSTSWNLRFSPYHGYDYIPAKFAVPESLPEGEYIAKLAYAVKEGETYTDYSLVETNPNFNNYYSITVKGDSAFYSAAGKPSFTLESYELNPNPLESDKESEITMRVSNSGNEWNGTTYFSLAPVDNDVEYKTYYCEGIPTIIKSGEVAEVHFKQTFSLPGGQYKLRFWAVTQNDITGSEWKRIGKIDTVTVIGEEAPADFLVEDDMWFEPDNYNVPKDDMTLHAIIKNEGGAVPTKIVPLIFDPDDDYDPIATLDTIEVNIGHMDTDTIEFWGDFLEGEAGKEYYVYLYNVDQDDWMIPSYCAQLYFTLGETTGITNTKSNVGIEPVTVYTTTGMLMLRTTAAQLHSQLATLPRGIYIVKQGNNTKKILNVSSTHK
jgi:hypothetical protein